MPPGPFTSPILFGREPDLAHLLDRVQRSGVTAVTARAQMGKSALLNELAARLTQRPDGGLFKTPLVGITESLGETSDLLLRAVSSLYTRWIASSNFREQGGVIAAQQNHDLIGRAGEVVGKLFKSLAIKPLEPVADLVSDTLSGLASANRDLKSGRLELPRLQTEEARDLLQIVADISGRPLVLIMDQWEKSPSPEIECNILDNFLRHTADWPVCHIFLGVRSDKTPVDLLAKLAGNPNAAIEFFCLPDMHLDTLEAQRSLLDALHSTLPFTATIPDAQLLTLLDGYPGTLARWLATSFPPPITTYSRLAQLADDANQYRYPEFDTELRRLKEFRPLAMRVALLPYAATAEGYRKLRLELLASSTGVGLDELKTAGILESSPPPSLGHAKRADAALAWFLANAHEELYDVTEALILSLAARIRQLTGDASVFAGSLSALCAVARQLDLSPISQALTQSAASVLQDRNLDSSSLTDPDLASSAAESSVILLSFGLFNFFNRSEPDSPLSSALLGQLRALSSSFAQVNATHIQFAMALFNAANNQHLSNQDRDKLRDELRQLNVAYPALSPVAEFLARALFNAFNDTAIADGPRREVLYAELSVLAQSNSVSTTIQESFSRATQERFLQATKQGDDPAAAAFLDRLRKLAAAYPSAPSIVLSFAMGLHNAMLFARNEPTPVHMEALLQELHALHHAHASDSAVAKQLSLGLLLSLRSLHVPELPAPESPSPDLETLREPEVFSAERLSKEAAATGTMKTSAAGSVPQEVAAIRAADIAARQAALEELKAVRGAALAAGESLLKEVRALHRAFEPNPDLGEVLATGLSYRVASLAGSDAFTPRQTCLAEMRSLILEYPSTRGIQERQAQSIFLTVLQTSGTPDGNPDTLAPLLGELQALIEMNRDSPAIFDLLRSLRSIMNPT